MHRPKPSTLPGLARASNGYVVPGVRRVATERQGEVESAAPAHGAFDANSAAVQLDDLLANAQAQTCAGFTSCRLRADALEGTKELALILGLNPWPLIGY